MIWMICCRWSEKLDVVALGQRFLQGHVCSDPLKRSRKMPGNKSHATNQLPLCPTI